MKIQSLALLSALVLTACGQAQDGAELAASPSRGGSVASLSLAPPEAKSIMGNDAARMIAIIERSGIASQSAIESSFVRMDEAFCQTGQKPGQLTACQFSIGSGLFTQASFEDTQSFIALLRKNKVVSRPIEGGRKWELIDLECSTRFVLSSRKLESTCTFKQF